MDAECLNCVGPATERYSVVVDDSTVIESRFVCDACLADFRTYDWIDVRETPASIGGD